MARQKGGGKTDYVIFPVFRRLIICRFLKKKHIGGKIFVESYRTRTFVLFVEEEEKMDWCVYTNTSQGGGGEGG